MTFKNKAGLLGKAFINSHSISAGSPTVEKLYKRLEETLECVNGRFWELRYFQYTVDALWEKFFNSKVAFNLVMSLKTLFFSKEEK